MQLDKTIRNNDDGEYIIIYVEHFEEGIEYAHQNRLPQIQLRKALGNADAEVQVDFKKIELLSTHLYSISFDDTIENITNFDSFYSLNLERIYFQDKQKFTIDVSKFTRLKHLGSDYWKGLTNIEKAYSLESTVLIKLPDTNLKRISELKKLESLLVYSSKIQSLEGIERLPIKRLALARNRSLENIEAVRTLDKLESISINKCKGIDNHELIDVVLVYKYGHEKLNVL
jgi:internalin A